MPFFVVEVNELAILEIPSAVAELYERTHQRIKLKTWRSSQIQRASIPIQTHTTASLMLELIRLRSFRTCSFDIFFFFLQFLLQFHFFMWSVSFFFLGVIDTQLSVWVIFSIFSVANCGWNFGIFENYQINFVEFLDEIFVNILIYKNYFSILKYLIFSDYFNYLQNERPTDEFLMIF